MALPQDGLVKRRPRIRAYLPPMNFLTVHYAYFVALSLVASLVFWGSSDPKFSVSYTDSLFLVVSAITEAGLNTVNLSQITTWQQIILFLLIILGSSIWVSIWTVAFRKHVFETRFEEIVKPRNVPNTTGSSVPVNHILPSASSTAFQQTLETTTHRAEQTAAPTTSVELDYMDEKQSRRYGPWVTNALFSHRGAWRNFQFHDLRREEREQLGGYEYRSLKLLSVVVPLYFFLWQFLGCLSLGAWINNHMANTTRANGINPWWQGIFNGASAFNNSGMSLLDANMVPFQNAHYVLVTMGLLILAGNTMYPIFLRLIFWAGLRFLYLISSENRFSDTKATLEFILRYPRRVYTNMFPSRPTWWLLFMVVLLNCIDWVAFELLNLGNTAIESIPRGSRILDGLFQAIAVRSGGFYVVSMSDVYIGLRVLYVIMMYISVYPVVITMRHSNIYEERSLGIYSDDLTNADDLKHAMAGSQDTLPTNSHNRSRLSTARELGHVLGQAILPWHGVGVGPPPAKKDSPESHIAFISKQIHSQLAHDLWWLVLAVFIITTVETSHFKADPINYSVFNVIFEVVSGYGCVGISIGLPSASYSFSGGWHVSSKLVLCLVMLRGRHRGLPVALDRAVRLPGEQLYRDEEEDYHIRQNMASRRGNTGGVLQAV